MKPGEFDLHLGSDRTKAWAGPVVALNTPCQHPGSRFDHGNMFVDIHNAGRGGRVTVGTSDAGNDGILKREQIAFMKHGAIIGFYVAPDSQAYQPKAQRHENRTELLRIGSLSHHTKLRAPIVISRPMMPSTRKIKAARRFTVEPNGSTA